jgi:hypothetical protein
MTDLITMVVRQQLINNSLKQTPLTSGGFLAANLVINEDLGKIKRK